MCSDEQQDSTKKMRVDESEDLVEVALRRLGNWPVPRYTRGRVTGTLSITSDGLVGFTERKGFDEKEARSTEIIDWVSADTLSIGSAWPGEKELFAGCCIAHLWQLGEMVDMMLVSRQQWHVLVGNRLRGQTVIDCSKTIFRSVVRRQKVQDTAIVFCHNAQTYAVENSRIRLEDTCDESRGYQLFTRSEACITPPVPCT